MSSTFKLPRLYAIIDAGCFAPVTKNVGTPPSSEGQGGNATRHAPIEAAGAADTSTTNGHIRPVDSPRLHADASAAGTPDNSRARKRWDSSPHGAESASVDVTLLRIIDFARELVNAGVTLIQYRNKFGTAREILSHARELKRALPPQVTFFLNDRADLCLAVGFDGVHVGQDDLTPEAARLVVGDQKLVGVSTHNAAQLKEADQAPVDYLAIGPIFATRSKENPDPVVGLEGLRAVRKLTSKPLVAIGGITRDNCRSVIDSGADSVAVIADLLGDPRKRAEEFLNLLGH